MGGISHKDPQIQFAAMLDLQRASKFDYNRRRQLYLNRDAWETVFNAICSIINELTIKLEEEKSQMKSNKTNWIQSYLAINSSGKSTEILFGKTQLTIWAIQSLSNLISLAKSEDDSGTILDAKSIPAAMNSLLSCLAVLDRFVELDILSVPRGLENYQILHPYPYVIAATLNSAIYAIITT